MWNSILLGSIAASLLGLLPFSTCAAQPPNTTMESAQFFPKYKSQRVKIRYGAHSVVPMTINNGMSSYVETGVQTPCTDCLITWIQAGLEYPNGSVANANTDLWLHHTVFTNLARNATVCDDGSPDTFFASGNERTAINICANGTDQAGYYIGPNDVLAYEIELMNMQDTQQEGVLTMTWEYIPSVPAGFDKVTALWLDIGGCNGSSDQPAKAGAFSYTSPPWRSDLTGRITFMGAHLHDGGTHLDIKRDSTIECDCEAAYGQSPGYIDGGMTMGTMSSMSMSGMSMSTSSMSMSMSMTMSSTTKPRASKTSTGMSQSSSASMSGMNMGNDTVHISSISTCTNTGSVNVGDVWTITAYYNGSQHGLMTNADGSLAPIMGIALLYVADNNLTSTATNTAGWSSASVSSVSTSVSASTSTPVSGGSTYSGTTLISTIISVALAGIVAAIL